MTDSDKRLGISRIGQIAVNAHDVARAREFYRDVLGLKFLFDSGPDLTFFDCGGVRMMITKPSGPMFDHPGSIIYYEVADVRESASRLKARGVELEADAHVIARLGAKDLWMAFVRDTEGNLLGLMTELPA